MGYREDAKVDIYNLHTEWAGQANAYIDYAEQYADAVEAMMRAEEKVKTVKADGKKRIDEKRAQLDSDIRIDPSIYDCPLGKQGSPTEATIASTIILHSSFKGVQDEVTKEIADAVEEYIKAVGNKELLEGVKIAFSHRKTALENEVQLFLNQYYSDPKVPKVYQEAQQEEVKKKIEETLKEDRPLRRRKPSEEGE